MVDTHLLVIFHLTAITASAVHLTSEEEKEFLKYFVIMFSKGSFACFLHLSILSVSINKVNMQPEFNGLENFIVPGCANVELLVLLVLILVVGHNVNH